MLNNAKVRRNKLMIPASMPAVADACGCCEFCCFFEPARVPSMHGLTGNADLMWINLPLWRCRIVRGMHAPSPIAALSPELIRQFDRPAPCYASYPAADRFVEAFDAQAHTAWLARRNIGGFARPLALYVHLPFCESLCYFCNCNKVITREPGRALHYLHYLERELALHLTHLHGSRSITHLHWGGGTPTFLNGAELRSLMRMLRNQFEFTPAAQISIEIDPRTVGSETIGLLAELGFNRVTLGVQDFDPAVQRAVNRHQSFEMTQAVMQAARAARFGAIDVELICGLPQQTLDSFGRTHERVLALEPDRIALYRYTHLPARFKPQRHIAATDLPGAALQLDLFVLAARQFTAAGYVTIGLGHFAKPADEWARALRAGHLQRSGLGYGTAPDGDLLGIGVSAISQIGPACSQNSRSLEDYYDRLDQKQLPVARGMVLTADDLVRRGVIMALLGQGEVTLESVAIAHLIDFAHYFARELRALEAFEQAGLVQVDAASITVTPVGRYFLPAIAMVFDRYAAAGAAQAACAKII